MSHLSRPMGVSLSIVAAICSIVPSFTGATPVARTVFAEEVGWIS